MAATATATARRRSTNAEMAEREVSRHRLHVVANNVDDVVNAIGAWLTDRALAGWEITVFLPDAHDATPLRILGLSTKPLSELRSPSRESGRPTAVAVDGLLLGADAKVRRHAVEALAHTAELTVWGATLLDDFSERLHPVRHEPSAAAKVFKRHAVAAASFVSNNAVEPEMFHSAATQSTRKRFRHLSAADADSTGGRIPAATVWAPVGMVSR